MRTDGIAEVQHYVPQLLLRQHANEHARKRGSEQVWCFDKQTDKIFSPNIKGILAASRFYEIEIEGRVLTLEPGLSKIEDQAAPIVENIVESQSLLSMTIDDRRVLSSFLAVQFSRTAAFRRELFEHGKLIEGALRKRGITPENCEGFPTADDDEAIRQ